MTTIERAILRLLNWLSPDRDWCLGCGRLKAAVRSFAGGDGKRTGDGLVFRCTECQLKRHEW